MKEALIESAEWRAIAYVVTLLFFVATGVDIVEAFTHSILLQVILFVIHVIWLYLRENRWRRGRGGYRKRAVRSW